MIKTTVGILLVYAGCWVLDQYGCHVAFVSLMGIVGGLFVGLAGA